MSTWNAVVDAVEDVRKFLNDGPMDKPVKGKRVFGTVDGVNRVFYAFDDRLVLGSLRATVNDVFVAIGDIVIDDPIIGQFTLDTAPAARATVRAHYYFQYFLDEELQTALESAAQQLTESDSILATPVGLKASAMAFAGHFAFTKQALRWAERVSSRFLAEEAPSDSDLTSRTNLFQQIANAMLKNAETLRTSYYTSHGRRNIPGMQAVYPRLPSLTTKQ